MSRTRTSLRIQSLELFVVLSVEVAVVGTGACGIVDRHYGPLTEADGGDAGTRDAALADAEAGPFEPDGAQPDASLDAESDASFDAQSDAQSDASIDAQSDAGLQGQPGTLDETFGEHGIATLAIPTATQSGLGGHGLAVQPDGRIVFGGEAANGNLLVGRVEADGGFDTGFADKGVKLIPNSAGAAESVRVLASGDLAIGGYANLTDHHTMYAAELLPNGDFDLGFASVGYLQPDVWNIDAKAYDMVAQPGGGLLLAGFVAHAPAFLRLTSDGRADPTFLATSADAGVACTVSALALVPDAPTPTGAFVAACAGANPGDPIGMRFEAGGAPTSSYGNGGVITDDALGGAAGVAVQSDGAAVFLGSLSSAIVATRFNANGAPDHGFALSMTIPGINAVRNDAIALTADGRILVAVYLATTNQIAVARFLSTGKLDPSFGGVGYVTTSGAAAGGTEAIAIDAAGRILVAASAAGIVQVARYWP